MITRGGGRSVRLARPFEKNLDHTIIGPTKFCKYNTLTANGKIFGSTMASAGPDHYELSFQFFAFLALYGQNSFSSSICMLIKFCSDPLLIIT